MHIVSKKITKKLTSVPQSLKIDTDSVQFRGCELIGAPVQPSGDSFEALSDALASQSFGSAFVRRGVPIGLACDDLALDAVQVLEDLRVSRLFQRIPQGF